MKREAVKNKITGITDEQLNWLMQENGADINREKSATTALTKATVYEKIVAVQHLRPHRRQAARPHSMTTALRFR